MTLHLNDAGTWRDIQGVYVNDAGTWREIQEVYVNDAGTWRSVFLNAVVSLSDSYGTSADFVGTPSSSYFSIQNDGSLVGTILGVAESYGTWVVPVSAAGSFECYLEQVFGLVGSGSSPTGAWISLASTRTWYAPDSGGTGQHNLYIRRASDGVVVDSCILQLDATAFEP
jgi:hypothetical protein